MSIIDEFKDFAVKGNVIDMAVGVIVGTAFGKIVSSFVTAPTKDQVLLTEILDLLKKQAD